jgi:hypothetical protein
VTQHEQPAGIMPGTPMLKPIPPRLLQPYLTGQRSVIAGYLYRAQDCTFGDPAGCYDALGLGYQESVFTRDMPEICLLRWLAMDMTGSLVPPPGAGPGPRPGGAPLEFFTLPIPIPVGAEIHRLTMTGEELLARYDGQGWLQPVRRL